MVEKQHPEQDGEQGIGTRPDDRQKRGEREDDPFRNDRDANRQGEQTRSEEDHGRPVWPDESGR